VVDWGLLRPLLRTQLDGVLGCTRDQELLLLSFLL